MLKKNIIIIIVIILFILLLNFLIIKNIDNDSFIIHKTKMLIPQSSREFLKKFNNKISSIFFVYRINKDLKNEIIDQNIEIHDILDSINIFNFAKSDNRTINDGRYKLTKYTNPLLRQMGPRSYLASNERELFLITGSGSLMYANINNLNGENIFFKKINSNFQKLVMSKHTDGRRSVVRSILIDEGKIYVSYIKKVGEKLNDLDNCTKTAVVSSDMNLNDLNFIEFFEMNECIPYADLQVQSGGNLSKYKENKILLTVGDWSSYDVLKNDYPQRLDNMIGKIISINKTTKKANILSLGHRNSQGLFYDKTNDVIYSTDHGPQGGDEINIDLTPDQNNPKNFGWAISSYGEHYGHPKKWKLEEKYKIAPLNKSHKKYGFIEPLKYFTPSIGITQIVKTENLQNKKVIYVGSMGWDLDENDLSIHKLILNNDLIIEEYEIIPIIERIRDLIYLQKKNKILMYLETSGSIAILERVL